MSWDGYFRFGDKESKHLNNVPQYEKPVRALPASWYHSPDMYEFERRAIFSRRWLFMTHSSRLAKTGDFLRFNTAGYDLLITRDRTGNINGIPIEALLPASQRYSMRLGSVSSGFRQDNSSPHRA